MLQYGSTMAEKRYLSWITLLTRPCNVTRQDYAHTVLWLSHRPSWS